MKTINKIISGVIVAASLGFVSCEDDLNLTPIDPNVTTPASIADNPSEYLGGMMGKCYSCLAVSGQGGPDGASDISGLDGGTSQYTRAIFMLNEFPTDEVAWIWPDAGVYDLNTNTWGTTNANIYGTYSRLMTHIAICNDFLRTSEPSNLSSVGVNLDESLKADVEQFRLEARALRALSYYYMIDLFGQVSMAWDDMDYGESPEQWSRVDAYNRVVADLEDVLAVFPDATPIYGRIGKDAVEALLCKFYLNAEVFTGTAAWDKCWEHAQNIIARHQGGGFEASNGVKTGLAKDYLALFCGNNDMFAPGGLLSDQNEILWNIPFDSKYTQPYGGTTFLIAAALKNDGDIWNMQNGYQNPNDYGMNANWGCMHARQQFSELFGFEGGYSEDLRVRMWSTDDRGFTITNEEFSNYFHGYSANKFNNLLANPDGTLPERWDVEVKYDTDGNVVNTTTILRWGDKELNAGRADNFPDTDYPMIRLADVYLMAAEAALHGAGNANDGLNYLNYVRERANVEPALALSSDNIIKERARELYWENCRRTDLVRFGLFTGTAYIWNWKGGTAEGSGISAHMNLYPIPVEIIAAQPEFNQNPGY